MSETTEYKLIKMDWHRNGVAGNGFWAIVFDWREGRRIRHMIATVFDSAGDVAVLEIYHTAALFGNIEFGRGNWCGDDFEPWLREQIERHLHEVA